MSKRLATPPKYGYGKRIKLEQISYIKSQEKEPNLECHETLDDLEKVFYEKEIKEKYNRWEQVLKQTSMQIQQEESYN